MPRWETLLEDRPLDRDPARSLTLPSHLYTSPEIFAREREAIFFKSWHLAGHVSDLPESGSYITASINDQGVFICRGKDGMLRGFYNVCAHRAHELLTGTGRARVITCPYHAWSYHLTGELRSARLTVTLHDRIWEAIYAPIAAVLDFSADRLNRLQFLTIRQYLTLVFTALVSLLLVLAIWP